MSGIQNPCENRRHLGRISGASGTGFSDLLLAANDNEVRGAGRPKCEPLLRGRPTHCYVSFFGRNVVTESMSGFLGPEEQAAARDPGGRRPADVAPDVARAILRELAVTGPVSIAALLPRIHTRPRLIIAILEDLERADSVRIRQTEFDEIVELTDSGRTQLAL
jgi:hypothetical protein